MSITYLSHSLTLGNSCIIFNQGCKISIPRSIVHTTPKKSLVIVQSFYLPWKGYFDRFNLADEVILYDDMQYVKRFWINRNQIKTPRGPIWLTVPVQVKGRRTQAIKDTTISDPNWKVNHWQTIKRHYSNAPFYSQYAELFQDLFLGCEETLVSRINYRFLIAICDILGIKTHFSWSSDHQLSGNKTERLVDLCQKKNAKIYLSGPTAQAYIEEKLFRKAGIEVKYMDYSGYPEYPQLFPPFVHEVSILDLIFNTGPDAPKFMKSFQP
jgi:hypothetical protein